MDSGPKMSKVCKANAMFDEYCGETCSKEAYKAVAIPGTGHQSNGETSLSPL